MRPCTCERIHRGKPWGTEYGQTCWDCWRFWHLAEHNIALGGDGKTDLWIPEVQRLVPFAPPPPVTLSPKSPRAVVTVAAGPKGEEVFALSGSRLAAYADRCRADLVVLRPPLHGRFPLAAKWHVAPVLDWYERIAFIDADVLIPDGAENIFDEVPAGAFGVFDELPLVLKGYPGTIVALQTHRETQKLPRVEVRHYLNSGVYVADRQHKAALATPLHPCAINHCLEQNALNERLHTLGTPLHFLAERWNYQWWPRLSFDDAPPDAWLHFSAIWDHAERLERMRAEIDFRLPKRRRSA